MKRVLAIVGGLALFAAVMYTVSMRRLQLGRPIPATLSSRARNELRKRVERRREGTPTVGTRRPKRGRTSSSPPPPDPMLGPPDAGTRHQVPHPPDP